MIKYILNGHEQVFNGDNELSLLKHLRNDLNIITAKDGCSGEGTCGACTVEIDGKARLACKTKMGSLEGASVNTIEGLPKDFTKVISKSFAERGAVQCGFCSPGMIMRSKALFNKNQNPTRDEIFKAISPNICRCTGYVKIVDAIEETFTIMRGEEPKQYEKSATIGGRYPKYQAEETALGYREFVDDIRIDGMYHGALRFSDHPRAKVLKIDTSKAEQLDGVKRIFTGDDIPGEQFQGLIFQDWPLMIKVGQITRYIGDVIASVVAETEEIAREAAKLIEIEYEVLEAVTDMHEAIKPDSVQVHEGRSNVLETVAINFGDVDKAFEEAAYTAGDIFETQRIEHAFLETEAAVALPEGDGVKIFTQGQGAYVDRKLIAKVLGLDEEKVIAVQVQNGGGFGGKEDMTV
ncbi:MAG: selenium-dependent xanthine dehydrogenase, partial [Salinivirgaceae bacterium]